MSILFIVFSIEGIRIQCVWSSLTSWRDPSQSTTITQMTSLFDLDMLNSVLHMYHIIIQCHTLYSSLNLHNSECPTDGLDCDLNLESCCMYTSSFNSSLRKEFFASISWRFHLFGYGQCQHSANNRHLDHVGKGLIIVDIVCLAISFCNILGF